MLTADSTDKTLDNRNYHHGDLRNALLRAAGNMLAAEGIDSLSLRRVADEVGVSRTAPYRHFANKEAMLAGLATAGFNQLRDAVIAATEPLQHDIHAMFFAGCKAYTDLGINKPCLYRLMFGSTWTEGEHSELDEAATGSFQTLVHCIAVGQESGYIKPAEPLEQAFTVWASLHGFVHLWIDGKANRFDNVDVDKRVDMILSTLLEGLQC